jgi:hypothetical protein
MPSYETLPTLSDDEIYRLLGALKGKMRHAGGNKQRVFTLQIEFCYIQREINIRQGRRKAHAEWLATQAQTRTRRPQTPRQ